jgi:hypothetical protein
MRAMTAPQPLTRTHAGQEHRIQILSVNLLASGSETEKFAVFLLISKETIALPVCSAVLKLDTGGLVVRWVTTSESLLLYVFDFFVNFCVMRRGDAMQRDGWLILL